MKAKRQQNFTYNPIQANAQSKSNNLQNIPPKKEEALVMPSLMESKKAEPSPLEDAFGGMNLMSGGPSQPSAP